MGTLRRRVVVWCALGLLVPAGPAWAAGQGVVEHKPERNCPLPFDRLTIGEVRNAVDDHLDPQALDGYIAYLDNFVDSNGDDILCLRIGPPDLNPAHGGPHILPVDNTKR